MSNRGEVLAALVDSLDSTDLTLVTQVAAGLADATFDDETEIVRPLRKVVDALLSFGNLTWTPVRLTDDGVVDNNDAAAFDAIEALRAAAQRLISLAAAAEAQAAVDRLAQYIAGTVNEDDVDIAGLSEIERSINSTLAPVSASMIHAVCVDERLSAAPLWRAGALGRLVVLPSLCSPDVIKDRFDLICQVHS